MPNGDRCLVALVSVLLVMFPVAAGAQLRVEGLPGDPPGEKTPFHYVGTQNVQGTFWFEQILLPRCTTHLTIETVTAEVKTSLDASPQVRLELGRAGHRASHVVGLTRTRSGQESALYQATHAVRWHHEVTPGGGYDESPIVGLFLGPGGSYAEFHVTVAGYVTGQCRRGNVTEPDR